MGLRLMADISSYEHDWIGKASVSVEFRQWHTALLQLDTWHLLLEFRCSYC